MVRILDPEVEILTPLDGKAILKHLELCCRNCYLSEGNITEVVITNTPNIEVPDTSSNSLLIYGIGSLIIIAGIVLIVVAKKPNNAKEK